MTDFDSIFTKYHQRLFLYTLKFVEDENEALDIVQNVFIAVWESGKFHSDEVSVRSYLFNAVKNNCLNYLKHQKVIRKFEKDAALKLKEMEAMHYQSGEKSLIEKESLKYIEAAIDTLSDIYREAIILSRFDGLKNCEIAQRLDIPVRTVETRIFRALAMLKEKIPQNSFLILFFLDRKKKEVGLRQAEF